jgi:GT2 family glycosyltransferase
MSGQVPTGGATDGYRELIHLLNQRYRAQWERAEQLRHELARARRWSLWPAFEWLRGLKRRLRPSLPDGEAGPSMEPCRILPVVRSLCSGRVSIIIPFKDRPELLRGCLASLRSSTYRRFEIVLVDNGSAEPRTRRFLCRLGSHHGVCIVDCPGSFNFSRLCNLGARRARGDSVLFLNNDTEVLTPDWLEHLLLLEGHPEVGIVGATLLYPDRTIQHAGIVPRPDGRWVHIHRGRPETYAGEQDELRHVRTVPAVTGACLLMRREQFLGLGGFDERLPVTFGDVDLCCRARREGLLVVVTPHARLLHFESLSRGYAVDRPQTGHLAALARFPQEPSGC